MAVQMHLVASPVGLSSASKAVDGGGRLGLIRRTQKGPYALRVLSVFTDSKPAAQMSIESAGSSGGFSPSLATLVTSPAGYVGISSEQKVYDVVLKQAALMREQLESGVDVDVKPELAVPGTMDLLKEAYDRCGQVCAEYAKTFYLGTLLMTPERRKATWAIYGLLSDEERLHLSEYFSHDAMMMS